MGFIKSFGGVAGNIVGSALGGSVQFVGGALNSDFIKEVGVGVQKSTKNTGELLGQVAEGTYKTVKGVITKDNDELKIGLKDIGGAAGKTAVGVGKGMKNLVGTSYNIIDSVVIGDSEEAKKGLTRLAKVAAIGVIGIGVLDGLDIIGDDSVDFSSDGFFDNDTDFFNTETTSDNIVESYVDPHHVDSYITDEGTIVDSYWRDGDSNTDIDLTLKEGGGFLRNNL